MEVDREGYVLDEVQEYKKEFYRFDIDSSPKMYFLYKKIYKDSIGKNYCISTPKFFRFISSGEGYVDAPDVALINRLFALPKGVSSKGIICIQNRFYEMYNVVERLSGDCFFNFNLRKIKMLSAISGIDKKKLKKCENMHHSIYNMVLLQTMGNMQKRKQLGLRLFDNKYEQLDRGDTFSYFLNQFYTEKNEEILGASTKSNKKVLRNYIESNFTNVYDYAEKMLQINDRVFIDKIIESGKKQLDINCVNNYLDIALEFWKKREEKIYPDIEKLLEQIHKS